ncbi:MAG: GIY-YIG nuclease family protein [Patescibacteria group bacterium]
MYSIYILKSLKVPRTYVGYSGNPIKRLGEHNAGKVSATRDYRPWKIFYRENGFSLKEAKSRELYWKSGTGRRNIKKIMGGFPPHFR